MSETNPNRVDDIALAWELAHVENDIRDRTAEHIAKIIGHRDRRIEAKSLEIQQEYEAEQRAKDPEVIAWRQQRAQEKTRQKQDRAAYMSKLRRVEAKRAEQYPESIETPQIESYSNVDERFICRVADGDAYINFGDVTRTENRHFSNLAITIVTHKQLRGATIPRTQTARIPHELTQECHDQTAAILNGGLDPQDSYTFAQAFAAALKHGYIDMSELAP